MKIFDVKDSFKPVAKLGNLQKGIYSVDTGNTSQKMVMAGGEGIVYIFNLK